MSRLRIGLLSDTFPPIIDGVGQAVANYAACLHDRRCRVLVAAPAYPGVTDSYPFPVCRYPSLGLGRTIGYRAGNPFDPAVIRRLRAERLDLLHVHAPFASATLARMVNRKRRVPMVLTYHTRFETDIGRRVGWQPIRRLALAFMLDNLGRMDEIWTVTKRCGQALREIGYKGAYTVMENGTDFPFGKAPREQTDALREEFRLSDGVPVFLFVGRMMWYKNIKLVLDALAAARKRGMDFHAFLVGPGQDLADIGRYARLSGLGGAVTFTGPVYDRARLRAFFSLADLFLFPSTYDAAGIVVKEAAACGCPSLLIRGSCAAEGVVDRHNGFLAEENSEAYGRALREALQCRETLRKTGENAGAELYLSWEDAVDRAYAGYLRVLNRF